VAVVVRDLVSMMIIVCILADIGIEQMIMKVVVNIHAYKDLLIHHYHQHSNNKGGVYGQ
jgi:hypothetical protein